jgi:hypothetical protein
MDTSSNGYLGIKAVGARNYIDSSAMVLGHAILGGIHPVGRLLGDPTIAPINEEWVLWNKGTKLFPVQ